MKIPDVVIRFFSGFSFIRLIIRENGDQAAESYNQCDL